MTAARCDGPAIIIDPGSATLKAGFTGDDSPRFEFPNIVGRPRIKDMPGCSFRDHYVGDEAQRKRGVLGVKYPVEHGMITNYEDMELVLHHTITEQLRADPKQQPVMVIEPALSPKCNREKITQIMFEVFEAQCFCLQDSTSLSLLGAGRTTGAVLESGDGATYTGVVYEGHTLKYTIPKAFTAGRDVTYNLMSLFEKTGLNVFTHHDFADIRTIKENVTFVSQNYQKDVEDANTSDKFQKKYELPDGRFVNVNEERFRCCECLFSHVDDSYDYIRSMQELVNFAIQHADLELRHDAYSNIVVSGGNTLFPGFAERLKKELDEEIPGIFAAKIIAPPSRKYLPWIGASIMTSLQTMGDNWISKDEYEETGPDMVHRKCF